MGKVFTWSEIVAHKVPGSFAHRAVIARINTEVSTESAIIAATFFGSTMFGSFDVRSDIDCALIYDPEQAGSAGACFQSLSVRAASVHVPVELIPIDFGIASIGMHDIGPSFSAHLDYAIAHGGLIKAAPDGTFPLSPRVGLTPLGELRAYVCHKLRKLEKGAAMWPVMDEVMRARFLEKVLTTPMYIARKVLWWCGVAMPNDSKLAVMTHYPIIATPEELTRFKRVLDADHEYSAELRAQLERSNKGRYEEVIHALHGLTKDTIEFVKLNALRLA